MQVFRAGPVAQRQQGAQRERYDSDGWAAERTDVVDEHVDAIAGLSLWTEQEPSDECKGRTENHQADDSMDLMLGHFACDQGRCKW